MTELRPLEDILKDIKSRLPPGVEELRGEIDEDSAGEKAIWVWVVLPDDRTAEVWSTTKRQEIRERLRTSIKAAGLEPWVYVRFRERSNPDKNVSSAVHIQ